MWSLILLFRILTQGRLAVLKSIRATLSKTEADSLFLYAIRATLSTPKVGLHFIDSIRVTLSQATTSYLRLGNAGRTGKFGCQHAKSDRQGSEMVRHCKWISWSRLAVYKQFKEGQKRILVATDLIGRGIDIERVNIVINYDMPETDDRHGNGADTYLHRVCFAFT
jgi:hypothetical protein